MEEKNVNVEDLDYSKLIAAQIEYSRNLKIRSISRDLQDEQKKKRNFAFISGICISAAMASAAFIDVPTAGGLSEVIQTEINALNSYTALKDYLSFFSPATYGSLLLGSASLSKYLKHKSKSKKLKADLDDMTAVHPSSFMTIVEEDMTR